MIFRANEEKERGAEWAVKYMSDRENPATHPSAKDAVLEIIKEHGPVVQSFPIWHPLRKWVDQKTSGKPFPDFDHVVHLQRGFITCPYTNGKELQSAVADRQRAGEPIHIRKLEAPFYQKKTTRWLVHIEPPLEEDGTLEREAVLGWLLKTYEAQVAWNEPGTWEDFSDELLGTPCGKRSSLFVNQKTGQAIKEVWEAIRKHKRTITK